MEYILNAKKLLEDHYEEVLSEIEDGEKIFHILKTDSNIDEKIKKAVDLWYDKRGYGLCSYGLLIQPVNLIIDEYHFNIAISQPIHDTIKSFIDRQKKVLHKRIYLSKATQNIKKTYSIGNFYYSMFWKNKSIPFKWHNFTGHIYFICDAENIRYIGITEQYDWNIRLRQHLKHHKLIDNNFIYVYSLCCKRSLLEQLEFNAINELNPKLNIAKKLSN